MTDERWQDILGHIKDKFEVLDHRTEALAAEEGPGSIEVIEFNGPLGRMKLNRTTKPRVLGKKIIGSKRIGSDTTVEYLYSDTEKSHQFGAYRWNEDEQTWVEMAKDRDTMIF
ncbi:MAG: hypothetical protein A3J59_02575 [Candidatus Buchananbacteria bacterium RIFCSPHIGHO2_02_FULL_56_16]|uniref:Uncharacterized protein n=1 Tax=Candidatus Buchananbacteria bacterium RIFCSPHIGHO2_02_FULL_56_16 TaxID=1797542 RepID=A0A1G1YGA8_9BACT|nr:MAG: hypothetical protein A3J59_02575 [Candidatus Buchananbacteria bacterium RIFCSPHIGHO2_02_FULL_56_16]